MHFFKHSVIVGIEQIKQIKGGRFMNIKKFTQKSMEAVNMAVSTADEYGNQEIAPVHLLYSLVAASESLIKDLLKKMDIQRGL